LDQGDQLEDAALLVLAEAVAQYPDKAYLYSDEDYWHPEQGPSLPHFKPDWSPDYYVAKQYTGRLAAFRTLACRGVGGFRSGLAGGHEFDLVLRITSNSPEGVYHITRVLYHRYGRSPRPALPIYAAARVLALHARGRDEVQSCHATQVASDAAPSFFIPSKALLSIVIPTAGRMTSIGRRATPFLKNCIESIRQKSTYKRYEIIVIDNGDLTQELIDDLEKYGVNRITYKEPFNLAAKLNTGASKSDGDYLVFLNDDTEVITPNWLERLLEFACQQRVGAVGAKLFFPDGRLQHIGVVLLDGNPGHPWYGALGSHEGYWGSASTPRNYLAVTGACMMTPREVFGRLGGFDLRFPLNYNDVDYCLRAREIGCRTVYTPYAQLYHYEAVSKEGGATVHPAELVLFKKLWGGKYSCDPYYNPNLSARHNDYRIRGLG
jgi:glycosyltransferase involved in cell wall biosynthesis